MSEYRYKYPHPAVSTDCVVFGFDGYEIKVLLIERGIEPYKGMLAFPGGFMRIDETAEECAIPPFIAIFLIFACAKYRVIPTGNRCHYSIV